MKLVTVLMLTALPLYCYAGLGCNLFSDVVDMTIDPDLNATEYINNIQEFLPGEETENAFTFLKECFLHQSRETLEKIQNLQGDPLDILPETKDEIADH